MFKANVINLAWTIIKMPIYKEYLNHTLGLTLSTPGLVIIFSFYKLLFFLIWTDGNGGGDSEENLPILRSGEESERENLEQYPFLLQMNSISARPGKNYFGRLQKSHIEEKCEELRALELCIL